MIFICYEVASENVLKAEICFVDCYVVIEMMRYNEILNKDTLSSSEAYRRVIETALKRGFRIESFDTYLRGESRNTPTILLRHDIDYSLELALRLAEINAEFAVHGTFFIQLRSPVYNVLHPRNLDFIAQMASCGQLFGLHFACPDPLPTPPRLRQMVVRDASLLEEEIGLELSRVIAWHNPASVLIGDAAMLEDTGFASAYAPPLFREGCYLADSNFRNLESDFIAALDSDGADFYQFLFHPIYWTIGGSSVAGILRETMRYALRECEQEFVNNPNWRKGQIDELMLEASH